MGPIYKYGLENNKQSKKPLSFAFQTDAEKLAASYGRDIGDTAIEQNQTKSKELTVQDAMEGNIPVSKSPQTSDTEARSVREGKLSREKSIDNSKKVIKDKKNESLSKLDKKKKDLNIDKIEATGQSTGYDDSSNRKQIRSEKRRNMRDIRNKERGAIRADRAARQIKKIGDKNNMTVDEATKLYETRKATLSAYNKDAMKETAEKVAETNKQIQAQNDLKKSEQEDNVTNDAFKNNSEFFSTQEVV